MTFKPNYMYFTNELVKIQINTKKQFFIHIQTEANIFFSPQNTGIKLNSTGCYFMPGQLVQD